MEKKWKLRNETKGDENEQVFFFCLFVRLLAFVFPFSEKKKKTKIGIFIKWTFEYLKILFNSIFAVVCSVRVKCLCLKAFHLFFIENNPKRYWNKRKALMKLNFEWQWMRSKSVNTLYCFRDFHLMKAIAFSVNWRVIIIIICRLGGKMWLFKCNSQFCRSIIIILLSNSQSVQSNPKEKSKGFY